VWQKTLHQAALLVGILLTISAIARAVSAADPMDYGDNRLGVSPMAPMTEPLPRYDNMRQVVPGPPVQPNVVSRPASWPGGSATTNQSTDQYPNTASSNNTPYYPGPQTPSSSQPGQDSQYSAISATPISMTGVPQQMPQTPPILLFEGTTILARVGSDAIFAYEIMGGVNEVIEQYKDKIPPSQYDQIRTKLTKDRLLSRIQSKLIYLDAKSNIPPEGMTSVEKQIIKYFESNELPNMQKRSNVESAKELDQKLRSLGSSLEREKKTFIERTLAQQWVHQQIKPNEEITYDQMLKYYKEHQSEFETPAKARWEEIMVKFSKFKSKAEARDTIAKMGNQILSGVPFTEVAKNDSQGPTSDNGGAYDWTTKGSLADDEIDRAIFGLPDGQLSQIIETEKGYHIIRVTKRVEIEITPFLIAQVKIKEKIKEERTNKQIQEYLSRLEDKIPIWTIYDGDRKNLRLADRMKDMR
jgi:hypothetical protein